MTSYLAFPQHSLFAPFELPAIHGGQVTPYPFLIFLWPLHLAVPDWIWLYSSSNVEVSVRGTLTSSCSFLLLHLSLAICLSRQGWVGSELINPSEICFTIHRRRNSSLVGGAKLNHALQSRLWKLWLPRGVGWFSRHLLVTEFLESNIESAIWNSFEWEFDFTLYNQLQLGGELINVSSSKEVWKMQEFQRRIIISSEESHLQWGPIASGGIMIHNISRTSSHGSG